jgi:sortase B
VTGDKKDMNNNEDTNKTKSSDPENGAGKKPRRKTRKSTVIFYIIPVVLIVIIVVFGIKFLQDYRTYQAAKNEYSALNQYISETDEGTGDADKQEATADGMQNGSGSETGAGGEDNAFQHLTIDFDELEKINSEFVAVIYVPSLDLRYPVAQAEDNSKYLKTTFDGSYNPSGCIFLDTTASKDFTDMNTFIFGHNMRNETMFGSLKRFYQKDGLVDSDPYVYLYTKDKVFKYRIFSYYLANEGSACYDDFEGDDGYDDYVKAAQKNSMYDTDDVDFTDRPRLLTLSTCSGTTHTVRFLVHSALVEEYDQKAENDSDQELDG